MEPLFNLKKIIPMLMVPFCFMILVLMLSGCAGKSQENESSNSGVFVTVNMDGVYTIGYSTIIGAGGVTNADASPIQRGETFQVLDEKDQKSIAKQTEEWIACTIMAEDKEGEVIAAKTFVYNEDMGHLAVMLTDDGELRKISD